MRSGFTLIELLIVIAVIGVISAIVLIAINPTEQISRGKDAGRKTIQSQLQHAITAYNVSRNGQYPTAGNTWITTLKDAGDLLSIPAAIDYPAGISPCSTYQQRSYCYNTDGTNAIAYVRLESSLEQGKCTDGDPYFLWSSAQSQAGVVCETSDPGNKYSGYTFLQ